MAERQHALTIMPESASGTQIGRVFVISGSRAPKYFSACGVLKGACGLFFPFRRGPDP